MDKSTWKAIGTLASIGGGLVALHGVSSKRWEDWHTVCTVVAIMAAIGTLASK